MVIKEQGLDYVTQIKDEKVEVVPLKIINHVLLNMEESSAFVILQLSTPNCEYCQKLDLVLPLYEKKLHSLYPYTVLYKLQINKQNKIISPHPFMHETILKSFSELWYPLLVFIPHTIWTAMISQTHLDTEQIKQVFIANAILHDNLKWGRNKNRIDIFDLDGFVGWVDVCYQQWLGNVLAVAPSSESSVQEDIPLDACVIKKGNTYHDFYCHYGKRYLTKDKYVSTHKNK